jgi:nucleoside-diphosphate-sugar epimerase
MMLPLAHEQHSQVDRATSEACCRRVDCARTPRNEDRRDVAFPSRPGSACCIPVTAEATIRVDTVRRHGCSRGGRYLDRVRIFLAGATGVIGLRLIPLLTADGHDVAGMTRSPNKVDSISTLGAEPIVCDVYDVVALTTAVTEFGPDTVINELTDLPDDAARILEFGDSNSRIRRDGTKNLLAAARSVSASRFLAQSVAWQLPGNAGLAAAEMERSVLAAGGVVLRYGQFYGPGTYFETERPDAPRVEVNAAAIRTVAALDAPSGIIVIEESA